MNQFDVANIHRDAQKHLAKWWTKFLDDAKPLKLQGSTKKVKTLDSMRAYCEIQMPRNLAIYKALYGTAGVMQLVAMGVGRWNTDDTRIIREYVKAKGLSPLRKHAELVVHTHVVVR